ncbi:hypothetical protein [Hydrococcus rivularis]|nr:hypothetical protein [Hydrococcus rivularis]
MRSRGVIARWGGRGLANSLSLKQASPLHDPQLAEFQKTAFLL